MPISTNENLNLNLALYLIQQGGWCITGGHNAKKLPPSLRQQPADEDVPLADLTFVRSAFNEDAEHIMFEVGSEWLRLKAEGLTVRAVKLDVPDQAVHELTFVRTSASKRKTRLVLTHPERKRIAKKHLENEREAHEREAQLNRERAQQRLIDELKDSFSAIKDRIADATLADLEIGAGELTLVFSNGARLELAAQSCSCYYPTLNVECTEVSRLTLDGETLSDHDLLAKLNG